MTAILSAVSSLALQASTGPSGTALINGTQTFISWTAPNDGNLHRFITFTAKNVATTETGGQCRVTFTIPGVSGSNSAISTPYAGAQSNGAQLSAATGSLTGLIAPGTTISIIQSTALTGGASTMFAEIWGA
jgi:hypothetical protein